MYMEKKLTTEEIAKVFAMYLLGNVWWNWEFGATHNGKSGTLLSVDYYTGEALVTFDGGSNSVTAIGSSKLLLTPLSNITDEHALALNKLSYPDMEEESKGIIYVVKLALVADMIGYKEADQLREWGYAVPYKGHDLFESGIAIEK